MTTARASMPSLAKSHDPPRLTVVEKLQVLAKTLLSLPGTVFGIAQDVLLRRHSASFRTICLRNIKHLFTRFSLKESRSFLRPTGCMIVDLCKASGLRHGAVEIDAGDFKQATLHFVDCDPEAPGNVFLYFHGGCYSLPLIPGHFKFAHAAAERASSKCVFLEYTLAPELKYPGQLAQAAAALRYLLQHHDASNIIIAGDSAGGNLALAVLAHLRKPHPLIKPIFDGEQQQLRAVLCISPRCANDCTSPSYSYNASKDIITTTLMERYNSNWGPVEDEVWAAPLAGVGDFWQCLHAKKLLIVAGNDEVFVDEITRFGGLVGSKGQVDSQLVLCAEEIHVQAIIDIAVNDWDGAMLKVALCWLQNLEQSLSGGKRLEEVN